MGPTHRSTWCLNFRIWRTRLLARQKIVSQHLQTHKNTLQEPLKIGSHRSRPPCVSRIVANSSCKHTSESNDAPQAMSPSVGQLEVSRTKEQPQSEALKRESFALWSLNSGRPSSSNQPYIVLSESNDAFSIKMGSPKCYKTQHLTSLKSPFCVVLSDAESTIWCWFKQTMVPRSQHQLRLNFEAFSLTDSKGILGGFHTHTLMFYMNLTCL